MRTPPGSTNTFEVFEFRPGRRWKLVMHGPDGSPHPNESAFLELAPSRLDIQHVSKPRYVLTATIAAHDSGAEITWHQKFEDVGVAARIRHIVDPGTNRTSIDLSVSWPASRSPGRKRQELTGGPWIADSPDECVMRRSAASRIQRAPVRSCRTLAFIG